MGAARQLAFCFKGEDFAAAGDIPLDTAGCSWGNARIGADAGPVGRYTTRPGYLVRDRADGDIHRLVVVDHEHEDTGIGSGIVTVFFELR